MEQKIEDTSTVEPDDALVLEQNSAQSIQCPLSREERSIAKFICRLCMKTFYNANALQNHRNVHHDGEKSDCEMQPPREMHSDQNMNGFCGFNFIPLKLADGEEDQTTVRDGLTTQVFSVDTTFLIIKIEEDLDSDAIKRSRLDSVIKKAQMKTKPVVDLRGPFTCTFPSTLRPDLQCRQIFFNCCDYSLHYRAEHTKRRKAALRCQVCEKRLDRDVCPPETFPVQIQPQIQMTFSCQTCAQTFLDSAEYDKHNRSVHPKMKPHQCSICAKRFTQQGGLQQHMRMHTGIRPFTCTYCPKAFTQKAGLDQHLRTHTKVKPFKCVICSKCFSQSVHLRQHMRTHTNIQPFECPVCGKRFKQSSHLNFHMRSHIGDQYLPVDNCAQVVQHDNQLEFLSLSNLQPIQDGETLYYAAELATAPTQTYPYEPQMMLPNNVLTF